MSIDTRGTGFIRVICGDQGLPTNINLDDVSCFTVPEDRTLIFSRGSVGDAEYWSAQESEQEIYDKIREARAEPVEYAASLGPEIEVFNEILPAAEESDQPVIDWRWVPKEYKWFAIDDDGRGWLYKEKPEKRDACWDFRGGSASAGFFNPAGWENSLQERPEGV